MSALDGQSKTAPQPCACFELSFECELQAVRPAVVRARDFLVEYEVPSEDASACEIALAEACNNAVLYAPADKASLPVTIQVLRGVAQVEMHVVDHTTGFSWPASFELPDPEAEHGRGLFIIQSLMTEVGYFRGNQENRLVMRRKLKPSPPAAEEAHEETELPQTAASPEQLEHVQQKLAITEHVISTMAKELCSRSEALAAIFRCASEMANANDLENSFRQLLGDLLHLVSADWYVLRLVKSEQAMLEVALSAPPGLKLKPVLIKPPGELTPQDRLRGMMDGHVLPMKDSENCAEARAALQRVDVCFGGQSPLQPYDPLHAGCGDSLGLVRPICMANTFLGTLAVGRNSSQQPFAADQIEVIHTFCDFVGIQLVNARLQQEHIDHQVISHELEIARNIQESLLPKHFPSLPGFTLSGFCVNARQVGGDFFDLIELPNDRLLVVVADVMGKGVPAALFAATFRTLVRSMTEWTQRPSELLARMNRLLYAELSGVDMFITAQIALVEPRPNRMIAANAGHCPLLAFEAGSTMRSISPEGMPLGVLPEIAFVDELISLEQTHCVVFYTDGVTEARNPHGEFFGQDRLATWVRKHAMQRQTAEELAQAFKSELKTFQSVCPVNDDQTFLVLSRGEPATLKASPTIATATSSPTADTQIITIS